MNTSMWVVTIATHSIAKYIKHENLIMIILIPCHFNRVSSSKIMLFQQLSMKAATYSKMQLISLVNQHTKTSLKLPIVVSILKTEIASMKSTL